MADSVVLKGVKSVRNQIGSDLLRLSPKRGGDIHQVKRWWTANDVSTVYEACTLFRVTQENKVCHLAIKTTDTSTIRIDVAADFTFTFYNQVGIKRAVLLSDSMEVIEHYAFPSISNGKIMTVIPAGAAKRPTSDTSITSVAIAGNVSPSDGSEDNYTVDVQGNAVPYTYKWVVQGGSISKGAGTETISVLWNKEGAGSVKCEVGSTNPTFNKQKVSDVLNTNVSLSFSTRVKNAKVAFAVSVADDVYELDGSPQQVVEANVGEAIYFDLSDESLEGNAFKIYTDSSKTTEVTVGIEQEGSDLLFTPPIAGSFSYQSAASADMGGNITVS